MSRATGTMPPAPPFVPGTSTSTFFARRRPELLHEDAVVLRRPRPGRNLHRHVAVDRRSGSRHQERHANGQRERESDHPGQPTKPPSYGGTLDACGSPRYWRPRAIPVGPAAEPTSFELRDSFGGQVDGGGFVYVRHRSSRDVIQRYDLATARTHHPLDRAARAGLGYRDRCGQRARRVRAAPADPALARAVDRRGQWRSQRAWPRSLRRPPQLRQLGAARGRGFLRRGAGDQGRGPVRAARRPAGRAGAWSCRDAHPADPLHARPIPLRRAAAPPTGGRPPAHLRRPPSPACATSPPAQVRQLRPLDPPARSARRPSPPDGRVLLNEFTFFRRGTPRQTIRLLSPSEQGSRGHRRPSVPPGVRRGAISCGDRAVMHTVGPGRRRELKLLDPPAAALQRRDP